MPVLISQLCVFDQANWYSYCGNSEYCMSSISLSLCIALSLVSFAYTTLFLFLHIQVYCFSAHPSSTAWLRLTRLRLLIDQYITRVGINRTTDSLVILHFVFFRFTNSCKINDMVCRKSYFKYIICFTFRILLHLLHQVNIIM